MTLPDATTSIKIEKDDRKADRALVTFDPVDSATGYRITAKNNTTQQEVFNQTVTGTVYQPIMNLEPGTLYDISVSALNETGEGPAIHSGFLTLPDVPGGFTTIQIDEDSIDLGWNTVSTATYYELDRDLQNIYGGSGVAYKDTGLAAGSIYSYRVSAANDTGFGDYSYLNNIWTLPAAISVLDSVYASTNEITLQWPEVQGAKGYFVKIDGQNDISLPAGTTQFKVSGLLPGSTHNFSVRPFNRSGAGGIKTLITSTMPEAPSFTDVKDISEESATIHIAPVTGATKYRVIVDGKQYDISDTELYVTGLIGGKKYIYSVLAGNSAGFSSAIDGEFLTLPHMPNGLKVKENTPRSVTFTWDKTESADSYKIMDGNGLLLDETTNNEFTANSLDPGVLTTFYVKAKNATGESSSAQFSWRTIPDALGKDTKIGKASTDSIELSWDAVPGADGYKIYDNSHQLIATVTDIKVLLLKHYLQMITM